MLSFVHVHCQPPTQDVQDTKPAKLFWLELVMKKSNMLNVYIELIRVLSSQALAKPGREEKERHGKTLFCSLHGWREPWD